MAADDPHASPPRALQNIRSCLAGSIQGVSHRAGRAPADRDALRGTKRATRWASRARRGLEMGQPVLEDRQCPRSRDWSPARRSYRTTGSPGSMRRRRRPNSTRCAHASTASVPSATRAGSRTPPRSLGSSPPDGRRGVHARRTPSHDLTVSAHAHPAGHSENENVPSATGKKENVPYSSTARPARLRSCSFSARLRRRIDAGVISTSSSSSMNSIACSSV